MIGGIEANTSSSKQPDKEQTEVKNEYKPISRRYCSSSLIPPLYLSCVVTLLCCSISGL